MRWRLGVGLAAVLAGCGGNGGLDRDALAEKADAICTDYAEQGEALGQPDLADPAIAERYFTDAAELARKQQAELEALEPAGDAADDFTELTAATDEATALLDDLAQASADEDTARRDELINQLPQLRTEVDDAAGAIGAQACAG